jgi:hypothetical protein
MEGQFVVFFDENVIRPEIGLKKWGHDWVERRGNNISIYLSS